MTTVPRRQQLPAVEHADVRHGGPRRAAAARCSMGISSVRLLYSPDHARAHRPAVRVAGHEIQADAAVGGSPGDVLVRPDEQELPAPG